MMANEQDMPAGGDDWRRIAVVAAVFQLAIALMVGWLLTVNSATSLAAGYFFDQDAWMLAAGGLALLGLACWPMRGAPVVPATHARMLLWSSAAALVAYVGCFVIFHHYAVSRDEQSATFAATYMAGGRLGWPIPASLRDLAQAMMPMHTTVRPGMWVSNYLPVNAAIRALAERLGDQWLAGPLLLLGGALALASAARRIWPDRPHGATVAIVLALTSTQVIVNAATPFAMTGHFALNALWLACFTRGDRRGHAAAMVVGLFASGLHQVHFHIAFVLGFVLWLASDRRYRLAGCYLLACVSYWLLWRYAWPGLLDAELGRALVVSGTGPPPGVSPVLWRLSQLQVSESLTRFIAWQNILLLPLTIVGAGAVRRTTGSARVLIGCAIACAMGLATMVMQDHGYGYRYLHHLIPCFCLLAAGGWLALEERIGRPLPGMILAAGAAFAALVTLPFAAWRTMVASAPYEAAWHAVRSADADYVMVDTRAGAYLQDIVRVQRGGGPVLLDLGYVPELAIARLCAQSRVMVLGEVEARRLGIPVDPDRVVNDREAGERAEQLRRLRCGTPLPLD
ncbi:hypothetical protein Q5H91_09895 [Sphingomonas sp. KR1UV-12]|uniref:Uncharacterized protein n=1 Tax=Sphingomonas aurea TaxID=3063994 RepID=A0ABT9EKQ3_9SPHN|nr:hypothetical protein [Sphingomonas sp. KR1UV-12]MDP1027524.1 hypothetical protein [Sphingomonas sp. KR1UV-12]